MREGGRNLGTKSYITAFALAPNVDLGQHIIVHGFEPDKSGRFLVLGEQRYKKRVIIYATLLIKNVTKPDKWTVSLASGYNAITSRQYRFEFQKKSPIKPWGVQLTNVIETWKDMQKVKSTAHQYRSFEHVQRNKYKGSAWPKGNGPRPLPSRVTSVVGGGRTSGR